MTRPLIDAKRKRETITLRLDTEQLRLLDALRREHANLPSRGEVIRRLIEKEAKRLLKEPTT